MKGKVITAKKGQAIDKKRRDKEKEAKEQEELMLEVKKMIA